MKSRITFGSLTLFAVALLLVVASAPYIKDYLETRRCGKRLATIGQAARVWAGGHNGRLPSGFIPMSNELVSPRLLICPGDKSRDPAGNWHALDPANSSYEITEGAFGAKDLPPEMLQQICYLQCKVHAGNYANALGKVFIYGRPIPPGVLLLAGLATTVVLEMRLRHLYMSVRAQRPGGTPAGHLLPRIEQVRRDHLAARGKASGPWYRKGLLTAARHAVRALAFFRDRKSTPQPRENPRTT
jgi:hypothetical protein